MTADDFHDRAARLEEHILSPGLLTADDYLDRAEKRLGEGRSRSALRALAMARLTRELDEEDDDS